MQIPCGHRPKVPGKEIIREIQTQCGWNYKRALQATRCWIIGRQFKAGQCPRVSERCSEIQHCVCNRFLESLGLGGLEWWCTGVLNRKDINPDACTCIPDWSRKTLADHQQDKRDFVYSRRQLENADTHDPYWNAGMLEKKHTGFMENYMRLYWGKKINELYHNSFYEIQNAKASFLR